MKKVWLVLAVALLTATSAMAQVFDFKVFNKTGYTIDSMYVSPADDEEWGDDVLGEDQLEDGDDVKVTFPKLYEVALLAFGVDKYDLKIEYEDGTEDEFYDLKLETINEVTLKLDKKGNGVATYK